jgi:hypothetical protein
MRLLAIASGVGLAWLAAGCTVYHDRGSLRRVATELLECREQLRICKARDFEDRCWRREISCPGMERP